MIDTIPNSSVSYIRWLPNYVLKVEDVTDVKQSEVTARIKEFIKETQEVKKIYDVKLLKDNIEVQPNGTLKNLKMMPFYLLIILFFTFEYDCY